MKTDRPQEPEPLALPDKIAGLTPAQAGADTGALCLTLPQAVATGLVQNPDLLTLRGQINVNQAKVGVARTLKWNPFVQVQYLPRGNPFVPAEPGVPASGAGLGNYYIWAMQRFEIAHQRRYRTQSALAALDQMQWNVYYGELLNVAQTVRLYFTALYQKELYDLAVANADLNERFHKVLQRRYKANLAKPSAVTAARIAARQSRRRAELAQATYQAAMLALRRHLGLPMTGPLSLTDRLAHIRWLPAPGAEAGADKAFSAAELVKGRPDVMAAQVGIEVATANWRLARAAMIPDIQAGPIYDTADDGTRYLGLRLQMDIPVWNTGASLARQRRAELAQQALTYEQLHVKASLEAQAAIDQYDRVRALAARTTPVPTDATPPELQEMTRLFEAGQVDILAVISLQNSLLQERQNYLDMLNQLAQSAAAVVQATGLPPYRLISLSADDATLTNAPCEEMQHDGSTSPGCAPTRQGRHYPAL